MPVCVNKITHKSLNEFVPKVKAINYVPGIIE